MVLASMYVKVLIHFMQNNGITKSQVRYRGAISQNTMIIRIVKSYCIIPCESCGLVIVVGVYGTLPTLALVLLKT